VAYYNEFELIEQLGAIRVSELSRISFNVVKIKGRRSFQILKEKRKKKWPEWRLIPSKASPNVPKEAFILLQFIMTNRGNEIKEIIDEVPESYKRKEVP